MKPPCQVGIPFYMANFLTLQPRKKNEPMSKKNAKESDTIQEENKSEKQQAAEEKDQNAENQESQQEEPQLEAEEQEAELEDERSELERVEEELAKLKDQHMRLFADFENYKKRTAKERVELYGSANMELMSALLPVVDDFQRALKNMSDEAQEGVQLIYSKLENVLKQKGLKPMESSIGKDFDVDTMEAVSRIPAPDKKQKGKVIDELEQGFYLGNKIIRYAKVVVGE